MSANTVSGPLNPEPSRPKERRKQGMEPKSYATATEELDPANGVAKAQEYTGVGEDAAPRSPAPKSHKRKGSEKGVANGKENGKEKGKATGAQGQVVTEKVSAQNGDHLTSIKPPPEYEEELRQDKKELKREPSRHELVSGRQAGQGWDSSGIRWAPLNVPIKRRLQTMAVLGHALSIAMFLSAFLFLGAIPIFWPILFPYTIYVLMSSEGSSGSLRRRSEWLRSSRWWSLFASYFPARLHRSQELTPTRKYIFGYHPHGIISHGAFAAFATEALGFSQLFPGITNTLLTLDSNFRIPFYREYALALGLASVDRKSIENLLTKGGPNGEGMGRAVTIVVGGARESLDAVPGSLKLVLKRRKGFVKLAVKTGADLVPVLGFGENELYEQVDAITHPWIHKGQLMFKKFVGWTVPLFHARGVFNYDVGLMPYRRPVNVVVGRPIKVEQRKVPDEAYVNELHEKYVNELVRLWDEWHKHFAQEVPHGLEIVE